MYDKLNLDERELEVGFVVDLLNLHIEQTKKHIASVHRIIANRYYRNLKLKFTSMFLTNSYLIRKTNRNYMSKATYNELLLIDELGFIENTISQLVKSIKDDEDLGLDPMWKYWDKGSPEFNQLFAILDKDIYNKSIEPALNSSLEADLLGADFVPQLDDIWNLYSR
jgi:hypothetical protein